MTDAFFTEPAVAMKTALSSKPEIRVRFAPAPTGYLHIGGARTALFNWLFARNVNGRLVLRIEDTDSERSTQEMVDGILDSLTWLGITWDEGPFYQSQRLALYTQIAQKLLESGHAYYCFCTKDQIEAQRSFMAATRQENMYPQTCRDLNKEEALKRKQAGEPAVLRFVVPKTGITSIRDEVFGNIDIANSQIEDFVLLRSDGLPTYHLSVVADDIDMRITHVIRGVEHLPNTPKQKLIYEALGAPLPVFAHVPLILGYDKTRLSKHHGATSVVAYRDEGIVPEAFRNFLALLGWTPPDSTNEVMGDSEMIDYFSLEGITRSNPVFDRAKLEWFNAEYIRACPAELLFPLIEEEWIKAGLHPFAKDLTATLVSIELVKMRARFLKDFATLFRAYFCDEFTFDDVAVERFLHDTHVRKLLVEVAERYERLSNWTESSTERVLRDFAREKFTASGPLINGARVALTGQGVAPSLFAVMACLGKERVVARLRRTEEI